MMSVGRTEGHEGDWVRGYMWVYQLTASLSRPFSRGSTKCLGVPAHARTYRPSTDCHTQKYFCDKEHTRLVAGTALEECPPCCSTARPKALPLVYGTMHTSHCSFRGMIKLKRFLIA